MKNFVDFIIKQMVDKPGKVKVEENKPDDKTVELTVEVDRDDIGKVIGKHGKNINALRVLVTALGAKNDKRTTLQVIE